MHAQAKQAGPELDRETALLGPLEAAGPAGPRLVVHQVTSHLGPNRIEATVTLAREGERFHGRASGAAGAEQIWQLAAAATVAAMQQHLQQHASGPSTPQVQLLDVSAITTGIGQEFIAAAVRVSNSSSHIDLLGSTLVRNDRTSTAVAAALDATSRYLGRFRVPPPAPPREADWREKLLQDEAAPAAPVVEPLADFATEPHVEKPVTVEPEAKPAPRAPVVASQSPTGFPAVGVVIGPTAIQVSAVGAGGEVMAEARRQARAGAPPEVTLSVATQAVREALSKLDSGMTRARSIGLAFPGRFASGDGVCVSSWEFPTWREVPVTAPFREEFGLPVALLTPLQAAAFAELSFGAAQGASDVLYVRVGRDIDVALITGGKPLALSPGVGGQAGHMVVQPGGPRCACGEAGCWQAVAGREALVARVLKALRSGTPSAIAGAVDNHLDAVTPPLIARMAAAGDVVARRALEETGSYLALGLANLIALFGPQAVILESQPPSVGAALLRAAEGALKSSPRSGLLAHCVLLSPELSESAPALGAAAWAACHAS